MSNTVDYFTQDRSLMSRVKILDITRKTVSWLFVIWGIACGVLALSLAGYSPHSTGFHVRAFEVVLSSFSFAGFAFVPLFASTTALRNRSRAAWSFLVAAPFVFLSASLIEFLEPACAYDGPVEAFYCFREIVPGILTITARFLAPRTLLVVNVETEMGTAADLDGQFHLRRSSPEAWNRYNDLWSGLRGKCILRVALYAVRRMQLLRPAAGSATHLRSKSCSPARVFAVSANFREQHFRDGRLSPSTDGSGVCARGNASLCWFAAVDSRQPTVSH